TPSGRAPRTAAPAGAAAPGVGRRFSLRQPKGRHGTREPLESDISQRLAREILAERSGHALRDQDLPALGLSAKARGEVADGPDGSVVPAALEADRPERGEALRDAD